MSISNIAIAFFILLSGVNSFADIKIGNQSAACTGTNEGSIRFEGTAKNLEFCNGTSWINKDSTTVTTGVIAFFAENCPTGWTEYTAARGRYIVGTPSGGSIASTVGTALTNLESRITGSHRHTIDFPSTTSSNPGNHSHTVPMSTGSLTNSGSNTRYANYPYSNSSWMNAAGNHSHTLNIGAFNSAYTGVSGTNAPFVQLTACQRD